MTPILIVKTANGFAVVDYTGPMGSDIDLTSIRVSDRLESRYSYGDDGLLSIVKAHFTALAKPIEPAPLKVVEPAEAPL